MAATLEAKILQEIMGMQKEVLYEISIDLHKDNDALEQGNALDIMELYRVVLQV